MPDMIFPNRYRLYAICLIFHAIIVCGVFRYVSAKGITGDPLWQKAVAIASANKGWVPGFAVLRIEIMNKHDKVEQYEETLLDFTRTDHDETAVGRYVDPSSLDIVGKSPFEPEFQSEILIRQTGESARVEGKQCIGYEYVWHREDQVLTGTACLEKETGIPVKIEFSENERRRSGFPAKQRVTVIFHSGSYDTWFPQRMTMEMEAGLLTLGRSFRITLDYEDYKKTE